MTIDGLLYQLCCKKYNQDNSVSDFNRGTKSILYGQVNYHVTLYAASQRNNRLAQALQMRGANYDIAMSGFNIARVPDMGRVAEGALPLLAAVQRRFPCAGRYGLQMMNVITR